MRCCGIGLADDAQPRGSMAQCDCPGPVRRIALLEPDFATVQPHYDGLRLIPWRPIARHRTENCRMARKHRRIPHGAPILAVAVATGLAIAPAANADDTDPPTRVGRIALLQGTVSFHPSPDDQWASAELNYPIAQSTAVWADAGGEAELEIGEARIKLASDTELDVVQLDDQNVILSVPQGRVDISLHRMTDGERYDIQTPRGDVDLLSDGNYRVSAGTDTDPTRVASFSGQAQLVGAASSVTVAANQEMVATPGVQVAYSVANTTQDAFDNSFFQAVAVVYARPVPAYVPPVPGVAALSEYGTWRDDPQYGHLWVPRQVEAGWQPYRRGHWGFVAPWGYTWIDDAPWGFAPFHYGRWVSVGGSWGWVPVERGVTIEHGYRPVYAPAMVTFIGNPAALTVGVAGVTASVGWVPLGPGEPWRPWYPHSDNYLRQANITNVNRTVITNITNTTIINNHTTYINQRAAIVVPQTAFAGGRPVAQAAYRIPPAALERPIEPARRATIEKVLPPPVVSASARQAILPPAPKLAMAHPAAASAAVFHAHPPAANVAPQSAIPKPGSNVVPKGTVIPPAAKPVTLRPAAEVKPEAQPAEPGNPGTAQPGAAPTHPEAQRPEAAKPQGQTPEAAKPEAQPSVAAKPAVAEPHAGEPAKPGAPSPHPVEQPKPQAQQPEPAKPGTPVLHPAEGPRPEAAKPVEPAHPATATPVPHPAEALKPEAAKPVEPAHPATATPVPHPAEAPKPEAAKPVEPVHPTTVTPAPHPAEAPKPEAAKPVEPAHPTAAAPAPHPKAEPPKPAAHPAEEPKPAAEPPKPAPHPAAAEPAGRKPGEPPPKEEPKKPE
jgi:hypothetical protein